MRKYLKRGFSLIEMLLVMVIIAVVMVGGLTFITQRAENLRIDKTALQIQYIMNAGLAFYVANGRWPGTDGTSQDTSGTNTTELQTAGYLPSEPLKSPYGYQYEIFWSANPPPAFTSNYLVVYTFMQTSSGAAATPKMTATANMIAGKLPFGWTASPAPSAVQAGGQVAPPTEDLSSSTAINFGGLYYHGACVPVPTCTPAAVGGTTMKPEIFVIPVSVSGVNDQASSNVYPISSFTAFASGTPAANPPACPGGEQTACTLPATAPNAPQSGIYWRVCLQVITQKGNVTDTRTDDWGNLVTLGAFTRCAIPNEPEGTDFSVYTH